MFKRKVAIYNMKYNQLFVILFSVILLATSCEWGSRTEYEVCNNTPYELSFSFYEFDQQQREVSMTSAYFTPHQTQYFEPLPETVAIKVYANDYDQWVQRIYYINKGKTTYILISPDMPLGPGMP